MAVQPDGLDPCDLRLQARRRGRAGSGRQRVPLFEFAIRSELAKHNLDTNEGQLAALDAAARIIARIKDRGLINRYAVSLDKWLGMLDEEFVRTRVLQQATRQSGSRQSGSRQSGSRHPGAMAGPNGPGEPARRQQQGEGPGQNGRPGEVRGDTGPGSRPGTTLATR